MTSSTVEQHCRRFSLSEIQSATEDFSDAHVIGKGGFGKVYKGLIDNGSLTVAIKRLALNSNQGEREFAMEMETLTKVRHRNLVSLIGYCSEDGEMILVYEYMANGTLADNLYKQSWNSDGDSSLSWNQRLKICIGAGRGLDYLHSGCSIIHRDVKSTNILLDENFTAKVSDFGLAKHLSANDLESHVSASVKGSFGYFDPSYFTTGRLTKASDTYAFGVVLLEVLSGRPANRIPEDELCMTMWAQEKIRNGKADQIVALNLKGEISEDCLKTFVGVAKRCLYHEPKKRPTMTRAVAQLELVLEQLERKGTRTQKLQFWPFWNRGSTQKDQNEVEVDEVPEAIPAIEGEDALENKLQTVDMQPIAAPAIPVDHIVDMLPIYVPAIPVAEIKDITDDFSSKCLIAEGSQGRVFHGVLKSGQDAAINQLHTKFPENEFIAQVSRVCGLKHENVVELVGYCFDGGLQILVYEFAPRSLHDLLHGPHCANGLASEPCPALSWAQRIKIAVGVATGLCYIHDKSLINHGIKTSNVLVFDDEIVKIINPHLSTECYGGRAYIDEHCGYYPPEREWSRKTQKYDVYSFGVLLLELLTGEKPFDPARGEGQEYLVPLAKPQLGSYELHLIVDSRLKAVDYPRGAVESMAAIAALCLQFRADFRPNMTTVLRALQDASQETQDYYLLKPQ